ncbi:hypothetical protein [Nakamurella sp. PAMC28650]|uniref:hypothetical protein n=1 Tax=Nakamurella sp. PAMC28650 TaxID=2762325 RepID=UPI00164DB7B8|nr:hypothetical protein [Nakamurella sp. PAMC28650]QNK81941.1 hypothetical protein H7F38_03885 [Nakamurella sp. PAMC28650]
MHVGWIAGGAGVAPFLSWLKSLAPDPKRQVDGRLTTEKVLTAVGGDTTASSVFMCGPTAMVESFQSGFRTAGVHGRQIYREYFDSR